jgi:hypothetical protein
VYGQCMLPIMSDLRSRLGLTFLAVAALAGVLTLPTSRRLGMAMLFLVILATGHALLVAGLGDRRRSDLKTDHE